MVEFHYFLVVRYFGDILFIYIFVQIINENGPYLFLYFKMQNMWLVCVVSHVSFSGINFQRYHYIKSILIFHYFLPILIGKNKIFFWNWNRTHGRLKMYSFKIRDNMPNLIWNITSSQNFSIIFSFVCVCVFLYLCISLSVVCIIYNKHVLYSRNLWLDYLIIIIIIDHDHRTHWAFMNLTWHIYIDGLCLLKDAVY